MECKNESAKYYFTHKNDPVFIEKRKSHRKKWHDIYRFGGNKTKVLERDNYKCQICGKNTAYVHHKNRNKSDNRLENLQTLCNSCHMKYHFQNGDFPLLGSTYQRKKVIRDVKGRFITFV